jgi:hypothetical protein
MDWSKHTYLLLKDIKKNILKKKIILSFMVESYALYDKFFRYTHMILAFTIPMISLMDQVINHDVEKTTNVTLVMSSVVAGMIKFKDYLKFDKIKELSKQQTIKYEHLYKKIERESGKLNKMNEEEFINLINSELTNLDISDPDIPRNIKKKIEALCKSRNVLFEDDIDTLKNLTDVKIDNCDVKVDNIENKAVEIDAENKAVEPPKLVHQFSTRKRSPSDDANAENYKDQMKNLNPQEDIKYAMERLNFINDE